MKNLKTILAFVLLGLMVFASVFGASTTVCSATTPTELPPYKNQYTFTSSEREFSVTLDYTYKAGMTGDLVVEMSAETNKDTLKQFEKYCKKKIDAASIGEVFYVTKSVTNPDEKNAIFGTYTYKVQLPKFYKNKDVAVIPFEDYRSPQAIKSVTVKDDGTIKFTGNASSYAYAIVYNGVYKDIILIGLILLAILIICVIVKVICLRRDNPYIKEKKKEKAIAKKKAEHKKNKRLAKQLKREKEKLKR